ncbi:MAG: hypothetical protein K2X07_03220 [Caulobacteraceae bacterium]|nr:hypothetical protein [Caulobacteraceae bacterium]
MRALLLCIPLLLVACAPGLGEVVIDPPRLDVAAAPAHAREAAARGDRRVLGVYEATTLFPGAGDCGSRPDGWWRHGQTMIAGTSDTPVDADAVAFNAAARRYAEAYNREMTRIVCG